MRGRRRGVVRMAAAFLAAVLTGCSASATVPATAPVTVPTTAQAVTGAPAAPAATTTTLDRIAEIEAIYQELEVRRLDALKRKDEAAFRALFANDAYLEESLRLLDLVEVPGDPAKARVEVEEVVVDRPDCIVAVLSVDLSEAMSSGSQVTRTIVLEVSDQAWGYSFMYGEERGWACGAAHPLSEG